MLPPTLEIGIRSFFFVLLLFAATHKVARRDELTGIIGAYFRSYTVIGVTQTMLIGRAVIALEIAIALVALLGPQYLAATLVAALMLAYAVAMAANLLAGNRNLDCGCSWAESVPVTWRLVVRNLVLTGVALSLLLPGSGESISPLIFANGLAVSIGGLTIYALAEQLLHNQSLQEQAVP
jgi:hypothetical protein